jgi:hypothetical protein
MISAPMHAPIDLAGFKKLLVFGLEIGRGQEAADLCSRFGVILR